MSGRPRERLTAYLVTLAAGRASGSPVYAVRTRGVAEALAAVQANHGNTDGWVVVGSLSTHTAKAIGLKPGDVRPI